MKLAASRGAAAIAFVFASAAGNAATYDFGTLLSGDGAPASPSFATLTATVSGSDILFSLNAHGLDLFTGTAPFIGTMAVDGTKTGSVSGVSGGVTDVSMANGGGPGGGFDFRFDFGGGGSDRLTDNETVNWTWVGGAGNYKDLALHVQGISYGDTTSAWYIPAVPEPEAYGLALAGMLVVGFAMRRKA